MFKYYTGFIASSVNYIKRKSGAECNSADSDLGTFMSIEECAKACFQMDECRFFNYGYESKVDRCWWEYTKTADCSDDETSQWQYKEYNFYEITAGITFITKPCTNGSNSNSMLSRSCFCNNSIFFHSLR